MEITDVVAHTLSLPAVEAEKADGSQDACVIEIETDEGITGVGEADSSPRVVEAIVEAPASHDKSAGLKEVLIGRDPFDVEVLWNEMFDRTYFYGRKGAAVTAISGVDMALWDVIGKATGRPLHQLLGGRGQESVRAYASTLFPADPTDTEEMHRRAEDAVEKGFTAVKFGWGGFGEDSDLDDALVGAARETLGDAFDIMVDAGMVFQHDVKQALGKIRDLHAAHDLYWVEEPVYAHDMDGYRTLAERCETRIVGGEEEYGTYGFGEFIERGRPDAVQPDVARSGGVTQMQKIATLADEAGIPMIPHGYSTDLIVAANLHIVAATGNARLLEYCVEDSPLRWDLVEESFPVEDGHVAVPDRPGLGVTLDRDVLEEYRVDF